MMIKYTKRRNLKLRFIILTAIIFLATISFSQKKPVDFDSWNDFPHPVAYGISKSGRFVWFKNYEGVGKVILVVVDIQSNTRTELNAGEDPIFANNDANLIYLKGSTLNILDLKTKKVNKVSGCIQMDRPKPEVGRWLAIRKEGRNKEIFIIDLQTHVVKGIRDVEQIVYAHDGSFACLTNTETIRILSFKSFTISTVFKGTNLGSFKMSPTQKAFAFSATVNESRRLYYYSINSSKLQVLINDTNNFLSNRYELADSRLFFNKSGDRIFFSARQKRIKTVPEADVLTSAVDVWSYKDFVLYPEQTYEIRNSENKAYLCFLELSNGHINQVEDEDDSVVDLGASGDYILVNNARYLHWESYWNKARASNYKIKCTSSLCQKEIFIDSAFLPNISTADKFVVWEDWNSHNILCIDLHTGRKTNLTKDIIHLIPNGTSAIGRRSSFKVAGWLKDDKGLIVYDQYDIWLLDPIARTPPICMTAGMGKKEQIQFGLIDAKENLCQYTLNDEVFVVGLSELTSQNGFFKTRFGKVSEIQGNLCSCLYYIPRFSVNGPPRPIKAKEASAYLVSKHSVDKSLNLFYTKDLVNFQALTSNFIPSQYAWMEPERISWKDSLNVDRQGVLYRPQQLDVNKKYPIIFSYYQKKSQEMYLLKAPAASVGDLNIPWYVSRGYAVFVPDITSERGNTADNLISTILSGANYIVRKYPWIDGKKIGLQGHSFGGYETNYIIANSNLFAAAQSSAGFSNLISANGDFGYDGPKSLAGQNEEGIFEMGAPFPEAPSFYLNSSPIFRVRNITTPLLIMQNKSDKVVPFTQGTELFISLRRINKPVWLLQYDGEGHVLDNPNNAKDFTLRQQQFFDHYLKGAPAPLWMVEGIPAKYKGIKSGLKLDPLSRKP